MSQLPVHLKMGSWLWLLLQPVLCWNTVLQVVLMLSAETWEPSTTQGHTLPPALPQGKSLLCPQQ